MRLSEGGANFHPVLPLQGLIGNRVDMQEVYHNFYFWQIFLFWGDKSVFVDFKEIKLLGFQYVPFLDEENRVSHYD